MARIFVHKEGKTYELFETEAGYAAVLMENPSEEQADDAILRKWNIVTYRVKEINEPERS